MIFLLVYGATAAPDVLSGDSAEFQFAATLPGVPHPTTYPLATIMGHLATRLLPFGTPAWRVTLVSVLCAALTVALFVLLAQRVTGKWLPAFVGTLTLGFAPGLWNAATLAEIYALLAFLIVALALALHRVVACPIRRLPAHLAPAALVAGLGCTHHGLFVLTALPLFVAGCLAGMRRDRPYPSLRASATSLFYVALWFFIGTTPVIYPFVQFARFGPFNGLDYGLPRHYFWGAPQSWWEVVDLLTGGEVRRGIFQFPDVASILSTVQMVGRRLWFEFGPVGVTLGVVGSVVLTRSSVWVWRASAWVFFATLAYLLLLGSAVGDAPVFTLPMLLPWALWIGVGVDALTRRVQSLRALWRSTALIAILIALTLGWGATRYRVSAKQHLWLYREFASATFSILPPDAVVIAHWEQGTTLLYLRLIEDVRPDVWIDVVEPGDDPWFDRAQRRYLDRPVYFVGHPDSIAGMPVDLVIDTTYANVYRLRNRSVP
ncbi:MAG: protein O-mannosyl-transferase family [Roseiflexus sp.]